jgi:hypothetical protein
MLIFQLFILAYHTKVWKLYLHVAFSITKIIKENGIEVPNLHYFFVRAVRALGMERVKPW